MDSTTTTWDSLGRPLTVTFGQAGSLSLAYDDVGRPNLVTEDSAGWFDESVATYYRPSDGRVEAIAHDSIVGLVTLTYSEPVSPFIAETTHVDGVVVGQVGRGADVQGRVTGRSVTMAGEATVSLAAAYDDAPGGTGMLLGVGPVALTRDETDGVGLVSGVSVGGTATGVERDALGRVTRAVTTTSAGTAADQHYSRDMAGRIVGVWGLPPARGYDPRGRAGAAFNRVYTYDEDGRLATEGDGVVVLAVNTYDANGNRTLRDVSGLGAYAASYETQDRLVTAGGREYAHNDPGQRTSMTWGAEVTTDESDLRGNLRHVSLPDGGEVVYTVDGRGRRIGRRALDWNGVVTSDKTWLYKDQLDPIVERDELTGEISVFVYASSRYVPDAMMRDGVLYRYVTDHLGSVRLIVNAATGAVAQRIDYDTWGTSRSTPRRSFSPWASPAGSTTGPPGSCASARGTTTPRPGGGRRRIRSGGVGTRTSTRTSGATLWGGSIRRDWKLKS